jgi:hypothetical protein
MNTLFSRILLVFFCLSGSLPTCRACLWDTDTLREESILQTNLVEVIAGKFPRHTPTYYEMRLRRVTTAIAQAAKTLELLSEMCWIEPADLARKKIP